jgi:hypothetical protein
LFPKYYGEIDTLAKGYDIDTAALMAIIEVESNGVLFGYDNRPVIRWEGHYFDRLVPAAKRAEARKAGLAHPKVGGVKNPKSQKARYEMLLRAMRIDKVAALSSISIGVGQVMGAHWEALDYASVQDMFQKASEGLAGQVELMLRYIVRFGLLDEIQRHDWAAFARGYNGPAYKRYAYDTKMARAYKKYAGEDAPVSKANGMLRMGVKGKDVRELQQLLVRAGFSVKVDGDFGPSTKDALMAFQSEFDLEADGVAGPETMKALVNFRQTPDEGLGEVNAMDVAEVKGGIASALTGGTAVAVVNEAADKVAGVAGESVALNMVAAGLTTVGAILVVGGLLYGLWGWYKSKKTEGVLA